MRKVLQKDSPRMNFKSLLSPRKVKVKGTTHPLSTIPTTVLDTGSVPYEVLKKHAWNHCKSFEKQTSLLIKTYSKICKQTVLNGIITFHPFSVLNIISRPPS